MFMGAIILRNYQRYTDLFGEEEAKASFGFESEEQAGDVCVSASVGARASVRQCVRLRA